MYFSRILPSTLLTSGVAVEYRPARPRREISLARSLRALDSRRSRRSAARRRYASHPGIGAAGDGDARALASGRRRARRRASNVREISAGRQAGPRAGDGRAVVLLIPGRRGATHPRRGSLARKRLFSAARESLRSRRRRRPFFSSRCVSETGVTRAIFSTTAAPDSLAERFRRHDRASLSLRRNRSHTSQGSPTGWNREWCTRRRYQRLVGTNGLGSG